MQTPMSRFQVHDELTAPEGSCRSCAAPLAAGGQLPNFLAVLAGSPAALRAYARFRSELRHGTLAAGDARAHLARRRPAPRLRAGPRAARRARPASAGLAARRRRARARVRRARRARGRRSCATCEPLVAGRAPPPLHVHEEAREAGLDRRAAARGDRRTSRWSSSPRWSTSPATCPSDGSVEQSRALRAA